MAPGSDERDRAQFSFEMKQLRCSCLWDGPLIYRRNPSCPFHGDFVPPDEVSADAEH